MKRRTPEDSGASEHNVRVEANVRQLGELGGAPQMLNDGALFVTSSPDWYSACFNAFYGETDELHYFAVTDGGNGAFLALVRVHRSSGYWLELCGSRQLFEPSEILYRKSADLAAAFRHLIRIGNPIDLSRVCADPPVMEELRRSAKGSGFVLQRPAPRAAFLPLSNGLITVGDLVPSAKRLRDLKRTAKRLSESGHVAFEWLRPTESEVDAVIDRAAAVEDSGWKRRQASSLRRRSEVSKFVSKVARSFAERRCLVVAFLTVDKTDIAMQIILEFNDAWHEVKIGYDEDWGHVSPGMQLTVATLLKASADKVGRYEFLGNEEPRHAIFSCQTHNFMSLVYLPYNLRGSRALADMIWHGVARRVGALLSRKADRSESMQSEN